MWGAESDRRRSGPRAVVPRPRLADPLTRPDAAPILVVQGPPGLGKSLLLDEVARRLGAGRVARVDPALGDAIGPAVDDILCRAVGDAAGDPPAILLDGVPDPDGDGVRSALRAARDHDTRVLLSTRTQPAWATADRQLDGTIQLVGLADLLFDAAEIHHLATRFRVALSPDDLAELDQTTDGWPALVVAALRARRPDAALSERRLRDLVDQFVRNELLGDLDPADHTLLTDVAAAPRFDASVLALLLEDHAAAPDDPAALIDRWATAGRLVPVADDAQWRLPHPVRRALLARLDVEQPGRRTELVTRTVRLLVAHGRTTDALPLVVDTALDKATAGSVVRASWEPAVARGQFDDLLPAVNTLPDDVIAADPVLLLLAAIAAVAPPPDLQTFARRVAQADRLVDPYTLSGTLLTIRCFQMVLARARGDAAAALAVERAGQALIRAATDDERREHLDRVVYFEWQTGANRLAAGDLDAAEAILGRTATQARHHGIAWHEANSEALRSYTSFLRGDLAGAARQARSAAEIARRHGWADNQFTDHVHLTRGALDLEHGRTAGVAERLHGAQRRLDRDVVPPAARLALAWSVLALLGGDRTAAGHAELLSGEDQPTNRLPLNRLLATIARAHALIARDDPEAATALLATTAAPPGHAALLAVARARALLAAGDPLAAGRELTPLGDLGTVPRTVRADVYALLVESALRRGLGPGAHLHQLFALIERTGARRPLLLLPALRTAVIGGELPLPPSGPLSSLPVELAALHRANTGAAPALSERETEVLLSLDGPETLSDIAKSMYISGNTLKTTARSLYRKLGAADRYEAVVVARALAILPAQ
ncbi:LuxR C-terminal-related transcriptional regulator [Jiangella mangrovi]|uniref:ATP/maltotriose-dependent transcriptional regulator MalT n=1 Tax=Jiangella mangrovi TaxID=1524084 RepID=A0A7W9GQF4_9ACTN|nr:LuxR C-terminal-related transcriptional regulator [Jiangella mangrovi]MBB5787821.1 ATP/maltotriose-dependent transcriptional regulator MalT [Jiangella mangrovi]